MKKKDKLKKFPKSAKIVIICVAVVLVVALISGGVFIYVKSQNSDEKITEKYLNAFRQSETSGADFSKVKSLNGDIKAFIHIENTTLPVFLTDNNEFYANHNADKKESEAGALYFDFNCKLDEKEISRNRVIYGQNAEDGSMFGILKKYEEVGFFKANPTIVLQTENGTESFVVFAVLKTNSKAEDNDGYCFKFRPITFSTDEAFTDWAEDLKLRSIIDTKVKVEKTDKTLTLVTFSENYESERLVVVARSVREGEDVSKLVKKATNNEEVIYPRKWYEVKGKEMPEKAIKTYKAEQEKIEKINKQLEELKK